ncbi:hypothetical protein V6N12_037492 [Hibiscus sabdariffa]|uniref:Uncharacterized protein n=1 Tax=Hibiscus sabdariffa TaxID=183260 RepID=A0ABR2ALW6_9ROSI
MGGSRIWLAASIGGCGSEGWSLMIVLLMMMDEGGSFGGLGLRQLLGAFRLMEVLGNNFAVDRDMRLRQERPTVDPK